MQKVLSFLAFLILELLFLPISLLGMARYTLGLSRFCRRTGVSLTAYKVAVNRWLFHQVGLRRDPIAVALLEALPITSRPLMTMLLGPTLLSLRLSGWKPGSLRSPVAKPSQPGTFVQHRTEFIDTVVREELGGYEQVVLLGAGFDSRPYLDPLLNFDGVIFELDREPTQRVKRNALNKIAADTSRVRYVSVDFERESLLDCLLRHGYREEARTLFLWEGVVYYIDEQAVDSTLSFIHNHSAPGSAVVFDYFSREYLTHPPLFLKPALVWLRSIGEGWLFGIPTSSPAKERLQSFLEVRGLQVARFEPFGPAWSGTRAFGGVVMAETGLG